MTRFCLCLLAILAVGLAPARASEKDDLFTLIGEGDAAGLAEALETGADPNVRQNDGYKATPLMVAASNPDPAMVTALLDAGADVNARDVMGDPAVNWAAYYGHAAVVAALLRAGADQTLTGHGNASEIAMRRGHQGTLAILLEAADATPTRRAGVEALEAAIQRGDAVVASQLLPFVDAGAATDWAGRPLLHAAARAGRSELALALIAAGAEPDAVDAIGFTAIFEAAREGEADTLTAILQAGADPDHVSKPQGLSLTALHLAATGGSAAAVNALAAAGADLNACDRLGNTPALWAAYEGKRDALTALIDLGADMAIVSDDGYAVLDVAKARGWDDIAARIDPDR